LQSSGTLEEDGRDERPSLGSPKPKLASYDEALRARVMSKSDATLAELQAWLLAEHNVKVSIGCLWKRLRQLGLTLKKSHCAPPSKIAPTSPRPAMNGVLNPEHLVFIDETGAKTNMARLYGRAPRGQRLVASVPHGHWMTTTFVAAL